MLLTVLITGGSGKLGKQLTKLLPDALAPSHQQLDIRNIREVADYIESNSIDTIIHCAALTSIRYCETYRKEAYNTNVTGTQNLIHALTHYKPDGYFIYISTACIFPGDNPTKQYSEGDLPYPKNYYALTKLYGETILKNNSNVLIVRTNFIERGIWPYPKAFMDRYANYLYSDQVAEQIIKLLAERMTGFVHVYGDVSASLFHFARLTTPTVQPLVLGEYHGPSLTVNMCLGSNRIKPVSFNGETL